MICDACNFENKDGATFCGNCGKPLQAAPSQPVAPVDEVAEEKEALVDEVVTSSDETVDDSEANTTVLTADMSGPLTQAMNNNQPQGFAPVGQQPPMGQPPVPPMGQPPMGMPPMGGQPMQQQPKAAKPPKAPKQPKEKSGGSKAYVVISIIIMLALAGGLAATYILLTKKNDENVDDYEAQIEALNVDLSAANSNASYYDDLYNETLSDLNDVKETISIYEEKLSDLNELDATYGDLINFCNSANGQGYDDFMASDTVLHLTSGETELKVFFAGAEGEVNFTCADASIATCEWAEGWEGNVATLKVAPVSTGNTTIILTNDQTNETITVYVYVD